MKNIFLLFIALMVFITGITTYRHFTSKKPLVIIMMGAPGSGKGTNASELSKDLKIPHISTGDLFRENVKNKTELGKIAKDLIDKGNFVPDNIVVEMLFKHIKDHGYDKTGYILDGFPRTLVQAKALDERLGKNFIKIAINLNVDENKLIQRITGRLVCTSCQTPYHITLLPPKIENKCDKCQNLLYQREDDSENILKTRLDVYTKETKPLLDYYHNQKSLKNIDSNRSKEVVFNDLLNNIEKISK